MSVSIDPLPRHDSAHIDGELRALLQALPTKQDIEALILRVEESHRREIQEVRTEIHSLADRVDNGEASISTIAARLGALEQSQAEQAESTIAIQLHMEDLEDRSRRNNLRLRGIPEATGAENLPDTVTAIFRQILASPQTVIEMDRVHRSLGPKSSDPSRPRDVICRLHKYTLRDMISRKAWEHGEVDFDGAFVKILPDLSRATLQRRARLRPLLDLAREKGCTYRWGYPLSVTFRKESASFTLRTPADLPDLFSFLEAAPIQVPNWLQLLPNPGNRPGQAGSRGFPSARPQRSRRRQRTTSGERSRES